MKIKQILIILWPFILLLVACNGGSRFDSYTVIERTNKDGSFVPYIHVVLQHDGHKYYARCNNIKAGDNRNLELRCNLHVGMTVQCQLFDSRYNYGYDLICGNKFNEKGDLDTYGENELLFIDKEEF